MLSTFILRMAEGGDRTMFVEQGLYRSRRFSYAEVVARAQSFARWLEEQGLAADHAGLEPGATQNSDAPRVVIWAKPGGVWAEAFYGCVLAGLVVAPVDAGFSPQFARHVAEHTSASLLITDRSTEKALSDANSTLAVRRISLDEIDNLAPADPRGVPPPTGAPPQAGDRQSPLQQLLEIVYTSGTTSEPRGVMITHGNLLANLQPVEKEIRRYRALSLPFRPLRFLHLIPLSHLFGQVMGLFIPQMLQAEVIFPESQAPAQLARIIRERRVSVMVSVPQQLEALGAWALGEIGAEGTDARAEVERALAERWPVRKRWWKFRRLHRALGWKMWAFVVGGARLPQDVESLWQSLGYAVVQGYGLTETAATIAITHPFKIRRGAVGRPLAGVETRIAPDGEILVRGPNVSPGYFGDPEATGAIFSDGWLLTGDLGRFDGDGNLLYLGRKKEMIVTAEGLNVFPEDVERALLEHPAIREAAVVANEARAPSEGGAAPRERTVVHAVVVPRPGAAQSEIAAAIEHANRSLEPHQRVRGFSIWPGSSLPRTISTGKIRRPAIAAWVNAHGAPAGAYAGGAGTRREDSLGLQIGATADAADWRNFLAGLGIPPERLRPEARLAEDLGLSSLDRVELMTWMESQGCAISEDWIAQAVTVEDVEKALRRAPLGISAARSPGESAGVGFETRPHSGARQSRPEPHWPVSWPAVIAREFAQRMLVFPLLRYYVEPQLEGLERLKTLRRPALLVANHQSFFDAPLILRALPWRLRRRVAPAMSGEAFRAHSRFSLFLTRLIFNGYLISEDPARAQEALRHAGWLAERGCSTLIFPEGERTGDGQLQRFRAGVGVMAERLSLPVAALRVEGLYELWPRSSRRPARGKARVIVGEMFTLKPGETPAEFVSRLENYYRASK